jgi:hypothetical protein
MIRGRLLASLCFGLVLLTPACSGGSVATSGQASDDASSWWQWHAEKRSVDRVVSEAINEPGGGDYAKAADAIRQSNRPPAVKQFQVGMLILGGHMEKSSKRPPETLEEGLKMMEDATIAPGQKSEGAVQQLRFLFERGDGKPPVTFPKNAEVAACWLAVEEGRSDDPARCIALRRERLPRVGV